MTCGRISEVWLARANGSYLGTQHANAEDVQGLPSHVLCAHVDDAVQTEASTDCCCRHAMLPGTSLGDNALLA